MIYLTHDIDWINPLHPYSLAKSVWPGAFWISPKKVLDTDIFLREIEQLKKFNATQGLNPIFLLGATFNQFGRYDLRYTIQSAKYKDILHRLQNETIGLHSDLHRSITDQQLVLQTLTNQTILYHRSHYLQHDIIRLQAELVNSNLQIDFSRGKPRHPEYMTDQTIAGIHYIPTVLFDNSFFFHSASSIFEQLNHLFERIATNQSNAAILFHPENMVVNPKLYEYYTLTLSLIRKHGISVFQQLH